MNEKIIPFAYSDLPAPVGAELQAVTARIRERLTQQVRDEDEVNKVYSAFGNFDVTQTILREAIIEVRQSYSNNVVTFPPKPWERHQ